MQSDSNNTLWTVSKHCSQWQLISFIVALRCMKSRPFYEWFLQDVSFLCGIKLKELSRHRVPDLKAFLHKLHRLRMPSHSQTPNRQKTCADPLSPRKPNINIWYIYIIILYMINNTTLTDTCLMVWGSWG